MLKFRFDTKGVLRLIALFHPLFLDLFGILAGPWQAFFFLPPFFSRSLRLKNPMFEYI
jgi:hypothetical protein